ncbi:MAG: PD40 domain-containing protein, partial [Caldilineaceae bacterium]|nr:PD40 domain-containing protein [Caldilineaceae bacterium]
ASVARRATVLRQIIGITAAVIIALAGLTILVDLNRREANRQRDNAVVAANALATQEVIALDQRDARATQEAIAIAQRDVARSRELAMVAENQIATDPELAILVALEANKAAHTFESEDALRAALHSSPLRATLGDETLEIQSATFSPDGSTLLISGRQAGQPVAQVLAFPSLNVQLTLDQFTSYYLYGASFAPNGSYILTQQDDNTASIWRVDNGDEVLTLPAAEVAWLPDSSGVIAATPNGSSLIQYWDLQQAKVIREFTQPTASDFYPHAIHVTPDQQQIVLFGWDDQTYVAQSWDLQTGTFLTKDELDPSVTIAPDGRLLAYGLDDNVILRDLVTHQVVMTGTGHSFGVYQVAFSPDGQRLASVGGDGAVRIWSVSGAGADAQIST